jgi:hypothetical protein
MKRRRVKRVRTKTSWKWGKDKIMRGRHEVCNLFKKRAIDASSGTHISIIV